MEWFKKILANLQEYWKKWTGTQKGIFFAIGAVLIASFILIIVFSSKPTRVPLLTRPITDVALLDKISQRLDQENVSFEVSSDNRIFFDNIATARRMRVLLTQEGLIPAETDPWELFDIQRWTQTDFERNINLRRSIVRQLEQHIVSLNDIDDVSITLVMPEKQLFESAQKPVTASVIISPKPGSDIRQNRQKIEGLERLIFFAVEGLQKENLTISDQSGVVLNNFANLKDFDRLELTKRELQIKNDIEQKLQDAITKGLAKIYTADRVQVVKINVDIDMSRKSTETQEHFPIETVPDNPLTPYNEREFVLTVPRSTEFVNEKYEGTGFNPEGPPGMEGQTPPAYKDLEGIVGKWSNDEKRINNEVNTKTTTEEKSPQIRRLTASVALDGIWKRKYDERGNLLINPNGSIQREYFILSDEELRTALRIVQDAVGYTPNRGDSVTVENLQFERTAQFQLEDELYRKAQQRQIIMFYSVLGLAVLVISFFLVRFILRRIEEARRRKEEELARRYQAMREAVLRGDEDKGAEGPSLEEQIIALVRERPADTAQLLRTWMMEE